MHSAFQYQIEVADDSATLYLSGAFSGSDVFTLGRVCAELPACVRTLRLDLHGIAPLEDDAMSAVRGVLRYWRESRGGSFRVSLTTDCMIATYGEGSFVDGSLVRRRLAPRVADATPALTAMYL